jgi:hypothetical protein
VESVVLVEEVIVEVVVTGEVAVEHYDVWAPVEELLVVVAAEAVVV